jgi:hypothetical protein
MKILIQPKNEILALIFWQNLGQEGICQWRPHNTNLLCTCIPCPIAFDHPIVTSDRLGTLWPDASWKAKSKCVANLVSLCKWMMANWIKPKMPSFPFAYQNMGKTGPISAIVHIQLFKIVQMDVPIQGTFGIWIVVLYSSFH